jgi:primosomal protein N' (replication factor Y) (superfamily II helicase)
MIKPIIYKPMTKIDKKYLIDAVPLIWISLNHAPYFTYLSPTPIAEGSYVTVELFRREVQAVVIRSHQDFERFGSIQLKAIKKIIKTSLLTNEQLSLAQFISNEYFCPLGICLKSFIPKIASTKKNSALIKNNPLKINLATQLKKEIEKIINSKDTNPILINGFPDNNKFQVYAEIAKRTSHRQIFICNSEILTAYHCYQELLHHFPSHKIAYLTSSISDGELYRQWENIRSGKARIIISTRIGLFAPFSSLGSIIINDAQDPSFKQWDMSPRYDTRGVAKKLGKIHQAKIFFQSPFASLANLLELKKVKVLNINKFPKKSRPQIETVNMKLEWKYGRLRSPISTSLEKQIGDTLARNEQVIIFLNQQGMSRFSVCVNCKKVLRCPKCNHTLVMKKSGYFSCLHCSYGTSLFPSCPGCQGSVFKNYGFGLDKIEKELEKFFPEAIIEVLTSSILRKRGRLEKIYDDFETGKINILIGTQMVIKAWKMPKLSLVAAIDADNAFHFPEYNTGELFWNDFIQCANRVMLNTNGKILLQTYHSEDKIFKLIALMDYKNFSLDELANRKILKYPPYYRLLKLTFKHKNVNIIEREIIKINSALKEQSENEIISPPFSPRRKSGLNLAQSILIKTPRKEITSRIRSIIQKLPSSWTIDADPVNIT